MYEKDFLTIKGTSQNVIRIKFFAQISNINKENRTENDI